ncbi:MAG: hypothetical protein AAGD25_20390 [Cyanobacteria bacterium P01_F01_bin.150]
MTLPKLNAGYVLNKPQGSYVSPRKQISIPSKQTISPQTIDCWANWGYETQRTYGENWHDHMPSCDDAKTLVRQCSETVNNAANAKWPDQVVIENGPHKSYRDPNPHITFRYRYGNELKRCHMPVTCTPEIVLVPKKSKKSKKKKDKRNQEYNFVTRVKCIQTPNIDCSCDSVKRNSQT